ncbi:NAD(P)/FAD-dependent oxidoreductase [Hydrogenimonas urashimensis]|uniref:NAD(P)/FAD-dependent oxidoreductase n=1 Tax=Hydrogenimonas urashimensis TaxID=2740515 RepID=UPI0019157A15|nr:NAD(P)/FAD-dependent oxidoreductase [Hydrogenimonas urashimensis]
MRVAIVGGGAAGLMTALTAAEKSIHIDLYESGPKLGRKILASGNGRCNISNRRLSLEDYSGRHPAFVRYALKRFDFDAFERFCHSIALPLSIRPDGRAYPLSNEARSVHRAFTEEIRRRGVNVRIQTPVDSIEKVSGGFLIHSPAGSEGYDRVVLAAGSPAAPQLGGTDGGLHLARKLGHTVVAPYPALVGLHLAGKMHEKMSGVKSDAALRLFEDGRPGGKVNGDLLFTRYGISGFAVLDISIDASRALREGRRVDVEIDLLPDYHRQQLVSEMTHALKWIPDASIHRLIHGFLPLKVADQLLISLDLPGETPCRKINARQIRQIAFRIKAWRFEVTDTHGYKHAESAGGGVATDEVDPKTMASQKVDGLFLVGEVLDIVGKRGGYNLHFAWASGYLAGKSL